MALIAHIQSRPTRIQLLGIFLLARFPSKVNDTGVLSINVSVDGDMADGI